MLRRMLLVMLMVVTVLALVSSPAGAFNKKKAQSLAQGLVAAYLPGASGPGLCEVQADLGFLPGNVYRDSCATTDGSFRYVVIVNGNGSNFKTKAALKVVLDSLANFCTGGGTVAATGVKGKFIEFHAGIGPGVASEQASFTIASNNISKVKGYSSTKIC